MAHGPPISSLLGILLEIQNLGPEDVVQLMDAWLASTIKPQAPSASITCAGHRKTHSQS